MKKLLLLFILFFLLIQKAFAEDFVFQSYYPAPTGIYDQLLLYPRNLMSTPCQEGMIYQPKGYPGPLLCKKIGASNQWTYLESVWNFSGTSTPPVLSLNLGSSSLTNVKIRIGHDLSGSPAANATPRLSIDDFTDTSGGNQDGSILTTGSYGSGSAVPDMSTQAIGNGITWPYFIWVPSKAVIRAGLNWFQPSTVGDYSAAFGSGSVATGKYSVIAGGNNNQNSSSTNTHAVILGGQSNSVQSIGGAIAGGQENRTTNGIDNFVGGGYQNYNDGAESVIMGGDRNNIGSNVQLGVIGGGQQNTLTASIANNSVILGGQGNVVSGSSSVIGGGQGNTIFTGTHNFIGGGHLNQTGTGSYLSVGGGESNTAAYDGAVVLGGFGNQSIARMAFVGGGQQNVVSTKYSGIAGGFNNQITGGFDTHGWDLIGGGRDNKIDSTSSDYSGIVGGQGNTITGSHNFIGGGANNTITGDHSVILGGQGNAVANTVAHSDPLQKPSYSWAGGWNMRIGYNGVPGREGENTFVWGASNNPFPIDQNNAFIIFPDTSLPGAVSIGAAAPNPNAKMSINGIGTANPALKINGTLIVKKFVDFTGSGTSKALWHDSTSGVIGFDLAENFDATETLRAGEVVIVDPSAPKKIKRSAMPYDPKAIGVVSSLPAVLLDGTKTQYAPSQDFTEGTRAPIALAGRVQCKVSLEGGPIEYGDLLTTSSTPGVAMKASDLQKGFGSIIGKSLEDFSGGTNGETLGLITILVSLQ